MQVGMYACMYAMRACIYVCMHTSVHVCVYAYNTRSAVSACNASMVACLHVMYVCNVM